MEVRVGCVVEANGMKGTVRFLGKTEFAPGLWAGLELFEATGKNDGSVQGVSYFRCEDKYGLFVRATTIKSIISFPPDADGEGSSTNVVCSSPAAASASASAPVSVQPSTPGKSLSASRKERSNSFSKPSPSSGSPLSSRASALPARAQNTQESSSSINLSTAFADPSDSNLILSENLPDSPLKEKRLSNIGVTKSFIPNSNVLVEGGELVRKDSIATSLATVNRETEELRLKLKVLEGKRTEDREKIRELEKLKLTLTEANAAKEKLSLKNQSLQSELKECQKHLKELSEIKDTTASAEKDLTDQLESLTLDKEMAEEKAESLESELLQVKEKLEETLLNLEILQNEHDLVLSGNAEGGRSVNHESVELLQLEKQNERLKEALIKLRDSTTLEDTEKSKKIKSLEKEVSSLLEYKSMYEKAKSKLTFAEEQIAELKDSLDDAMEAESLVEEMTMKVVTMEEMIQRLKEENEDLLALKDVNDELEEQQQETEKQLRTENDSLSSVLADERLRNAAHEAAIADYERTILQFRDLVKSLQSDVTNLREREKSQRDYTESLSSQSKAMMSLNVQLQSTVLKSQAKQLELELKRLETLQAQEHLKIVQCYLSKSFRDLDKGAIDVYLTLERLAFKCQIILNHLEEMFQQDSLGVVTYSAASGKKTLLSRKHQMCVLSLKVLLQSIYAHCFEFHVSLSSSKPENFLKTRDILPDLRDFEKVIDGLVESSKRETIFEIIWTSELSEISRKVSVFKKPYINVTVLPACIRNEIVSEIFALELCVGKASQISFALQEETELTTHNWKMDPKRQDLSDSLKIFVEEISKSVKGVFRKLDRRFSILSESGRTVDNSIILDQYLQKFGKADRVIDEIYSALFEDSSTLSELSISRALSRFLEKHLDVTDGAKDAKLIVDYLQNQVIPVTNELYRLFSDESLLIDVDVTNVSPWISRGKVICSEYDLNHEMQKQVSSLTLERANLLKELRERESVIQDYTVKVQHSEGKVSNLKTRLEEIPILREQLDKAKEQERTYEEAIDSLHADIEKLESRLAQQKETSTSGETKRPPSRQDHQPDNHEDSRFIKSHIINGGYLIEKLKKEIINLKGRLYKRDLDPAGELSYGWSKLDRQDYSDFKQPNQKKVSLFLKDVEFMCSSFKVVDLSLLGKKKLVTPYQIQESIISELMKQSASIQDELLSSAKPALQVKEDQRIKTTLKRVGQIVVKNAGKSSSYHHSVNMDFKDFQEFHSKLLVT